MREETFGSLYTNITEVYERVVIRSPVLRHSAHTCTLSFNYKIHGKKARLLLYVVESSSKVLLWTTYGTDGELCDW